MAKYNVTLDVEDKVFTNEQGEEIQYQTITCEICGETVRLNVKNEDKKLFRYLLKKVKQ